MDDKSADNSGEAAAHEADLVEIPNMDNAASEPLAWRRLKAGFLVEAGRADRKVAAKWQQQVVAGSFRADAAADELLAVSEVADDDDGIDQRTQRLMRDLVMAPKLRGASGAARAARKAGRNVFAFVLAQLAILTLFAVLFAVGLIVARWRGVAIDPLLDRVVEHLPAADV